MRSTGLRNGSGQTRRIRLALKLAARRGTIQVESIGTWRQPSKVQRPSKACHIERINCT